MKMNTSRMIELALVFLVSLLSFSVGTFVGKKYSDNQHRLAQLEPKSENATAQNHETHATDTATIVEADKPVTHSSGAGITDSDVAKLAEEFASEEESTSTAESASAQTAHKTIEPAVTAASTRAAINKTAQALTKIRDVKEISAAEANHEQARDVASIPPSKGLSQFTVQVGAYTTTGEAEKMTNSLKARGYKATYVSALVNEKTYYRVQVGLFDSFQEAQDYKKELMDQNRLTSAIIQKVQR